uniref:hypothetical protein n=1 Tax=Wolbachia pipientis TaxID=955 RepID=UPI0005718FC4
KILDIRTRSTPLSSSFIKYRVFFPSVSNQRSYNSLKAFTALAPALLKILETLDRFIRFSSRVFKY